MPYKTRDEMLDAWASLEAAHPTLVSHEIIGKTVQNRDILLYKIGNPRGGRVSLVGAIHGEEKASAEILYLFVDWVLSSSSPMHSHAKR